MLSKWKKVVFAVGTFCLFILLIGGVEAVLRAYYPPFRTPFVTEASYDGIVWLQVNRSYLRKYFSGSDAIVPEFKSTLFRKVKLPSTYRILCIGESSMFGVPYQMTANIPGIVRKQLRHLHPEREIEVINLGASAINTNVILDMSAELLDLQPDLVLVYTGHNEFYGPDGVGASFLEKRLPFLTPLKYSMRGMSISGLIRSFGKENSETSSAGPDITLMEQVSRNNKVALSSDDAERIFSRFESNLRSMVDIFAKRNVPLIVSDISSNLTFPPFASTSDEWGSDGKRSLGDAEASIGAGQYEPAIVGLTKLMMTDSTDARTHFQLGNAYAMRGDFDQAKRHLALARDYDLLKFRAPGRINEIIRKVCALESTPCISSDSLFQSASPHGIPGNELFWEHLHPTPTGYYLIANLFVNEIEKLRFLPAAAPNRSSLLPNNPDSLSICWLDLAYGDVSIKNLTNKWPFKNYSITPRVMGTADDELRNVVSDVYERRVVWDLGCYQTAQYFWRKGKWRDAITTYEAVLEEYPYNFYTHYLLASVLGRLNMFDEAVRHYTLSIASNPGYPYPRLELGLMKINMGEFDEAIGQLTKAAELAASVENQPFKANIFYGLATAYANKGDFEKARTNIDFALKLVPQYKDALILREKIAGFRR